MNKLKLLAALVAGLSMSACSLLPGSQQAAPEVNEPSTITTESIVDDNAIERDIRSLLENATLDFSSSNINVVALNGRLLLVGQVPSQTHKNTASELALQIQRVRHVHNELTVGENISSTAHANDAWISVKVKSRMISTDNFPSRKVTIVTEDGVVYLLGTVEPEIVNQATKIAAEVQGVQKVVHLFDLESNNDEQ